MKRFGLFLVLALIVPSVCFAQLRRSSGTTLERSSGWSTGAGTLTVTDSSLNVGINSSSPTQKLAVDGSIYATGNVGIGISVPVFPLHIQKDDGVAAGEHSLVVMRRGAAGGGFVQGYHANGTIVDYGFLRGSGNFDTAIGTNSYKTAVYISNSSGNVGIGTSVPGSRLSVAGSDTANTTRAFNVMDSTYASKFTVTNAGNVGIGTSLPGRKLEVDGTIYTGAIAIDGAIYAGTSTLDPCATLGANAWLFFNPSGDLCQCKAGNDVKVLDGSTACF